MDGNLELVAIASIGLIIYAIKKWALKGEIFHPGLIYTLVNSLFFIVFVFGPYEYRVKLDSIYSYIYVLVNITFIIGLIWGEKIKSKVYFKDIIIKANKLYVLALIVIAPLVLQAFVSGLLSGDLSFQDTAKNNLTRAAMSQANKDNVNLFNYIFTNLFSSFTVIATSIFLANLFQKKRKSKYFLLGAWIFGSIVAAILDNSRTLLFMSLLTLIIPIYLVQKNEIFAFLSKKAALKNLLNKNLKNIVIIIFTIALLVTFLSNLRSSVRTAGAAKESRVQVLEEAYQAVKKDWFFPFAKNSPESLFTPVAELSMYAGGTVASGGVIARISTTTEMHTLGLRYFFVFHRLLSQTALDGGFSDFARGNLDKVSALTAREMPIVRAGWFSDPGNLILDFGYLGAPIAALINGVIIGWAYSRFSDSSPVLKSTATSILSIPMLITPAMNFFGADLSRLFNFVFLIYLYLTRSRKTKKRRNSVVYLQEKIR